MSTVFSPCPNRPTGLDDRVARRLPAPAGVLPVIRRESLRWTGGTGGRPILVQMEVENPSDRATQPVVARIGAALLGAFVPSQAVDRFSIPALPPGGRMRLARGLNPAVGGMVLPPQLLQALGLPRGVAPARTDPVFWAGNLDVWMDRQVRVERHCAALHCLLPGRDNYAAAFVSAPRGHAVSFQCSLPDDDWRATLFYLGGRAPVEQGDWYPATLRGVLGVLVRPPKAGGAEAGLVVNVTRRSDGRTVPVEFRLRSAND